MPTLTIALIVCCAVLFVALVVLQSRRKPEPGLPPPATPKPPSQLDLIDMTMGRYVPPKVAVDAEIDRVLPKPTPIAGTYRAEVGPVPLAKLHEHFRALRKAKGLTGRIVAERTGMVPSKISQHETVRQDRINASTIVRFATALEQPITVLFEPTTDVRSYARGPYKPKATKQPKPAVTPAREFMRSLG